MANPQTEEGYTKIANEITDAFCRFRIPGGSWRVLMAILRKTYGYNKKEDWISHSQIVLLTGISKGNVSRELSQLITHKIVIASDNKLRLNKNYTEWIQFGGNHYNPKLKVIATDNKSVIESDNKVIASDKLVIGSEGNKRQYTKAIKEKEREKILVCTEEQIWKTAVDLRVSKYDVERTYREILRSIEEGDKYKVKNAPMTLVRWVQRGLRQGDIEQISDLEYMGLKHDTPERVRFVAEMARKRAEQEEKEYAARHKQQV